MADQLTEPFRSIAASQGWELRDTFDTRGYCVLVAYPTATSKLKSVEQVSRFMFEVAKRNDPTCLHALRLIAGSVKQVRPRKKKK